MKIFYLFLLFPLISNSQILSDKYINIDSLVTTTISFQNSEFKKSSGIMLAHGGHISKGKYTVISDTIVLEYIPYKITQSKYEISNKRDSIHPEFGKNKKIDSETVNISTTIIDINNQLVQNPIVVLKTDKKVIGSIHPMGTSQFNYFSTDNTIEEIEIMKMGYEPVVIPLKKFKGYFTDIKVILKVEDPNAYNSDKKIEKYLWNKKDNTLQLLKKSSKSTIYKSVINNN